MTIKELAKLANTSPATVSLALNGRPGVNPETRQRITELAEKHGYNTRKRSGMGLSGKIIRLIAISKPNTSNIHNFRTSFFAEIINYIQTSCSQLGYMMVYSIVSHEDFMTQLMEQDAVQPCEGAVILATYLEDSEIDELCQLPFPYVLLDRSGSLYDVNSVSINNYAGAYSAIRELALNGHRHIGYICSASNVANMSERKRAFFDAVAQYKLDFRREDMLVCNSYVPDGIERLSQLLGSKEKLPSAFFCENDYNALSLISALTCIGLTVPGDVSVIGFDNVPECIMTTPRLTTIHVDRRALALAAINRLHYMITNPDDTRSQSIQINTNLIRRVSVRSV